MSKEAMKLALEALQECRRDPRLKYEHPTYDKAIKALEEALAKQEQGEPVRGVYWKCVLCGFAHIEDECPECGHHTRAEFAFPQPHKRKPLADEVLVPLKILEAAESSLGAFCSDEGWGDEDMQNMDNLSAYIAQHKAAHGIKE